MPQYSKEHGWKVNASKTKIIFFGPYCNENNSHMWATVSDETIETKKVVKT